MKIGILSDSHDDHVNVQKVIDVFNESKVEMVLHGGDFISPSTACKFSQLEQAGFIGVFGNCDRERDSIKSSVTAFGGEIYQGIYTGQIDRIRVFMTHCCHVVDDVAASGLYDLVIYGHTHKRDIRKVEKAFIVNPGETANLSCGDSSVVMLDTGSMNYEVVCL